MNNIELALRRSIDDLAIGEGADFGFAYVERVANREYAIQDAAEGNKGCDFRGDVEAAFAFVLSVGKRDGAESSGIVPVAINEALTEMKAAGDIAIAPLRTFSLPCVWQMAGTLQIEAATLAEAEKQALGIAPLPKGDYIEDSIELDKDAWLYGTTPTECPHGAPIDERMEKCEACAQQFG